MADPIESHVSDRDLFAASRAVIDRMRGKRGPKRVWERIDLSFETEKAAHWLAKERGLNWSQELQRDTELQAEARELAGRLYMKRLRRLGLLPPKNKRPICGARCRDGHACNARAVFNVYRERMSTRCKWHGGLSTGPTSTEGRAKALIALAKGRAILAQRKHPKST